MHKIIREWYSGLSPLQKIGLFAVAATVTAVGVTVAAPKLVAAGTGAACVAVGAKALAYAFSMAT